MWVGLDILSWLLIDATIATSVFLSLIVLLMLLCRQPARRIVLSEIAIVVAGLMMPLTAINPLPRLELTRWITQRSGSAGDRVAWTREFHPDAEPPQVLAEQTSTLVPILPENSVNAISEPLRVVGLIYLLGVAVGLLWLALGFWGVRRLVRRSSPPGARTAALYATLLKDLSPGQPAPTLRVSSRVGRPVLVGLLRSTIVLPDSIDVPDFNSESLHIILVHELAHANRADAFFGAVASLVQSVWFFLPHVWWLRAQLRMDQEFLADQRTVQRTGSPAGYASQLVEFAASAGPSSAAQPPASSPSPSGWRGPLRLQSPLLQRVVMLLHCPFPIETRAPRWWAFCMMLMVMGLGLLGSSLRVFPACESRGAARSGSGSIPGRFVVPEFLAESHVNIQNRRNLPYVLPVRLPGRFALTTEIWGSAKSLAEMRLAGFPLDLLPRPVEPADANHPGEDLPGWHQVKVWRNGEKVTLQVDTHTRVLVASDLSIPDWLTIHPSSIAPTRLRRLVLEW
jgi:beta-lactamase regulating signal transducer with metallopeptidase domain